MAETALRFRIPCEATSPFNLYDKQTGGALVIPRACALRFEIGRLVNQLIPSGNMSSVTGIRLQVRASQTSGSTIYLDRSTASITTGLTLAQWQADTDQHAAIEFTATEANITLGGALYATYWMDIWATTASATFLLAGGEVTFKEGPAVGAGSETSGPSIVPTGAAYSGGGTYSLSVNTGEIYAWYDGGANDTSYTNGGSPVTTNGYFVAAGSTVTLTGTPSATITALVYSCQALITLLDARYADRYVVIGAYNAGTAYLAGHAVTNQGGLWGAKIPTTGNSPPVLPTLENTQWLCLAEPGDDGLTDLGAVIAAATAKATVVDADSIGICDSAASNATKEVTFTQLWTNYLAAKVAAIYAWGTQLHGLNEKTNPVAADEIGIADSAASWVGKRVTLTNVIVFIKAQLDSYYAKLSGCTFTGAVTLSGAESTGSQASTRTYAALQGTTAIAEAAAGAALLYVPLAGGTMTGALAWSGTSHPGLKLLSLTTVQRDALSSPQNGWMIYDSTLGYPVIYYGSAWNRVQTGSPGVGDMVLADVQTVTGKKTFGGAGAVGKFALAGTTSGSTILDASAVASGTLTLPAATDTVLVKELVQIVKNKIDQSAYTTSAPASGTVTLDLDVANRFHISPTGNFTIAISNGSAGQVFEVVITQDGTGGRTPTWFTTIRWAGGTAPSTWTASKRYRFGFVVMTAGSAYDGHIIGQEI